MPLVLLKAYKDKMIDDDSEEKNKNKFRSIIAKKAKKKIKTGEAETTKEANQYATSPV